MEENKKSYRVLARKYRPQSFEELVGQEALVRTLKNAIENNRIAHAFMLTGVRGTGKTTTARIIAKAVNYTGKDGKSGPTSGDTSDCEVCKAIAEDRHPDVIEMDAASRTGVDDIREIIDGVRYAPTSARYKIYIIDEVHMLSKNAFNALLKTLEEPPEHVIFIFATTEIRKVPITVLSRCQRFDLRRVDVSMLSNHYKNISDKEGVKIDDEALGLISRAADGSVRDGMSLLDQSIALGGSEVTSEIVKDMLGLADRALVLDMLEHALKGECNEALEIMEGLYFKGASPTVLIQDLLEFIHLLTKLRAIPEYKETQGKFSSEIVERALGVSLSLSMPTLGRAWQIVLKGVNEVNIAPNAQTAAEMIIIRLAYAADLPDPADLLKRLEQEDAATPSVPVKPSVPSNKESVRAEVSTSTSAPVVSSQSQAAAVKVEEHEPQPQPQQQPMESLDTLEQVVCFLENHKEMILASQIFQYAHLVKMQRGRVELRLDEKAPKGLSQELRSKLIDLTGEQWMISLSSEEGAPTLAAVKLEKDNKIYEEVKEHPVVKKVLEFFPESELKVSDIDR
jgi:DNA polymerase-3 subunit gamma/tau